MSDQENGSSAPEGGEGLTNVKAEFNRKLSNFESKISGLEATNAQLIAAIQSMAAPKKEVAPAKKIEDVWFDKPTEAAETIVKQAEERIMKTIDSRSAQLHRQNQTLSQLVSDFPELSDNNHELTKSAVAIYSAMSEEDKTSPLAYKAAVREAASELGIMPKAKRRDEDFSVSGSGSSSARSERTQTRTKGGLDPATEEFARLVGVNVDDPKVKDRIKARHGRRSYNNWE